MPLIGLGDLGEVTSIGRRRLAIEEMEYERTLKTRIIEKTMKEN